MSVTRKPNSLRTHLLLLVSVALLAGCSSERRTDAQEPNGRTTATIDINDYLPQAGLKRLLAESDLIVRGTVVETEDGAVIGDDSSMKYTILTISVGEVISGPLVRSVDVALLTEVDGAPVEILGRPVVRLGDDGVWLLTEIPSGFDREGYVLTNQRSLIIIDENGNLVGSTESTVIARQIEQLRNVWNLLEFMRSASND